MSLHAEFPSKLKPLFTPSRYKVAYGGRGSAKSWSFARALLIQAAQRPLRVLCAREIQKSIKDSVHQLLKDQIDALGLSSQYEVFQTEIRGVNGSLFLFSGLSDQTTESIKSFEGIDRVWVEEAKNVSKRSWDILIPTIRKSGSEIWVSFNPDLETDETYERFVKNPPPDCISMEVNYYDNPWFPPVLEIERKTCEVKDPRGYLNIWAGKCKPAAEGAIYYDEMTAAADSGRIRSVPRDPALKVHRIWDLGFNDSMSIILAQRVVSEIAIVGYVEDSHRTLADYIAEFKTDQYKGWNWGYDWLPHDGFAKRHQTGKADSQILSGLNCSVMQIPNMDVEQGIRQARLIFPRVYFDKDNASRLLECLKRYRRNVSQTTNEPGAPRHDEYSHGADAFRYLAIVADQLKNEDPNTKPIKYPSLGVV